MYCGKCGFKNRDDASFCGSCGNKLAVVEVKEEQPAEEVKSEEGERVFKLKYANFLQVKETEGLFLFFLDRQTVIILPKTTYVGGEDFAEFKNFILSKINPKRVKFLKK